MGGFPYTLPGTFPAKGAPGWDVPLAANLADLKDRTALHEATYGAPLDAFPGGNDDTKLSAAMAYAKAQTRPPAILLSARGYTFNGGPYPYYPGFRFIGSLGHAEREFTSTGPHTVVTVGGNSLFSVPSGGVRVVHISGIQFRAANGTVDFQEPVTDLAAGPVIQDGVWVNCGWVGFATVMHARVLRAYIDRTYVNNGTDHQFKLGGADSYFWLNGGYMSSPNLAASKFYVWFTHQSRSTVGPLYLTPERATGFRIDGSHTGLVFRGTLLDSTNRNATTACQGAAILITGGRGHVFDGCYFFNNAVNPSATGRSPVDKGQVYLRGSTSDVLFTNCQWIGGAIQDLYTPAGTPAIYAATGVTGVKVANPMAPAGGAKLLQHQSAGIITKYGADDWALNVA